MGLFQSFFDYISVFVSSDPTAARKRRELREIHAVLKGFKPAIIKPGTNLVLPGFAVSVMDLYQALRPFKEVMDRTLLAADSRIARRYKDFIIERSLGDGDRRLLDSCTYDSLKKILAGKTEISSVMESAEEDFRMLLKAFDSQGIKQVELELAEMEGIAELCRYDFEGLLKNFDPAAKPESIQYKPKFSPVEGTALITLLLDLYFVAVAAKIGPTCVSAVAALSDSLSKADGESSLSRFSKAGAAMGKALAGPVSPAALVSLLRVLREEPQFTPAAPDERKPSGAEYRDRLRRRWAEDRDRILREYKESTLAADVEALFGAPQSVGLLPLTGFSDELLERLQKEQSKSLAWVTPLRMIKTFERKYVSTGFLEVLRRLVLEGFFQNAVLRTRLTDSVANLEKMGTRIASFEDAFSGNSRSGAPALKSALDDAAQGKDRSDAVEKIIRSLDDRAKELVGADVRSLHGTAESVLDVLNDCRKPTPDLVSNIKTLAASKDKAFVPTLLNGYNGIARLLKIMQAYTVVATPTEKPVLK